MSGLMVMWDGNNTAYRANSVHELYTKKGVRTSAIYGVLTSMRKDIERIEDATGDKVCDIYFIMDGGRADWRKALYPEYKAGRRSEDEDDERKLWFTEFYEQLDYLEKNLSKLGIKSIRIKGWEADDILYAMVDMNPEQKKLIVSTDMDMLQMVSPQTTVYSPTKDIIIDHSNFEKIMGIPQSGFISYKLLLGDTSDNIKGIPGIGEVTGKDLIRQYGDLAGVLAAQPVLMKSKRFAKIFTPEGLSALELGSKMMDLTHVDYSPIIATLEDAIDDFHPVDDKAVMVMLKELEMVSILMDYKRWIQIYKEVQEDVQ